jgi:hypothetical protein
MGLEILREKNQFKLEHGFNPSALRIPKRILEIDSPHGKVQDRLPAREGSGGLSEGSRGGVLQAPRIRLGSGKARAGSSI